VHCAEPLYGDDELAFSRAHRLADAPEDDVLTMLALPGQVLYYSVEVPRDHQPGLFWYHTHPHGESGRQVSDGMSGAIVIKGMERYAPEMRSMRERVIAI
jgi:suppressor of ftsI